MLTLVALQPKQKCTSKRYFFTLPRPRTLDRFSQDARGRALYNQFPWSVDSAIPSRARGPGLGRSS